MSAGLCFRIVERAHGHLGVLAAAALFHPAVLLRRRRRGRVAVAVAATALVTVTGVLGVTLYPTYREVVKPILFARWPAVAWAFERKEHLGVAAILASWTGLGALWAETHRGAGSAAGSRAEDAPFARVVAVAYLAAAIAATIAAVLGVVAASHTVFAD